MSADIRSEKRVALALESPFSCCTRQKSLFVLVVLDDCHPGNQMLCPHWKPSITSHFLILTK